MAGVDHGGALVAQPHDTVQDGVAALRVHGHGGFVEEDELGLVRDAARDVQPAQQTARQLARTHAAVIFQAHELDGLVHQRATALFVGNIQRAEAVDVFSHGQLVEHGHLLRHHADAALQVVTRRRHRLAEQTDVALVVGEQLQHAIHGRGFTAAVRPQKAENLAFVDAQVEVVQRQHIAVTLHQIHHRHHRPRHVRRFHFGHLSPRNLTRNGTKGQSLCPIPAHGADAGPTERFHMTPSCSIRC